VALLRAGEFAYFENVVLQNEWPTAIGSDLLVGMGSNVFVRNE
jgi:hypothetical protein